MNVKSIWEYNSILIFTKTNDDFFIIINNLKYPILLFYSYLIKHFNFRKNNRKKKYINTHIIIRLFLIKQWYN